MSQSAPTLKTLASLNLPTEAYGVVLSILAEMQAAIEQLEAAETAQKALEETKREKDRARKIRGRSMEIPRKFHGNSEQKEIPPTPPKEKLPSELPRGSSSGPADAGRPPIYSDSVHELWGEGIPIRLPLIDEC